MERTLVEQALLKAKKAEEDGDIKKLNKWLDYVERAEKAYIAKEKAEKENSIKYGR